jgi:hypothetical protein
MIEERTKILVGNAISGSKKVYVVGANNTHC